MTDQEKPGPTRAQRFGQFIAQAAREAGYDIDGQRSGGRKALAEAAGMGQTAVGRMLAGQSVPDPRYFEPLARAVHIPLRKILIEAGVVSADALGSAALAVADTGPLTVEAAAARLGIRKPANVRLFVALVENMRKEEDDPKGDSRRGVA